MKKIDKLNVVYYALLSSVICLLSSTVMAGPPASYPVPPDTDNRLFYLQRSSNSNTVVYDANLLPNGRLNPEEPVEVYWMRYNSTGERKDLSFVERKFAYGLQFNRISDDAYMLNLLAYSGRDIKLVMDKAGKAVAQTVINNQPVNLKSIYLEISGSGFWTTVNYIELVGLDLKEGKLLRERFDPNSDDD